ncbi:hypothetical protein A2630_02085 [Candidatus Woesebacteria bacterium RIFCSPHIGHO2_01_FULL_44_10]|uniref:OBG-type G domain-containing protein n=1 Tax=Candidatus Woesebacteria bacterium RIFCSPLOWO2_01_FULL_44_14 TaxID=1802525 RepID=A0A1F8BXY7_9BACT|nr:MAG: hypothetical protein A2630_02085 [Candidatus Woesebacteria bacterium RIFCSPHIGHO2_01_FULL_44_10]OGM55779.1 MAG: hypothetical protein A3F62_04080 [Candidatus Woesebacteria bacterium RIFCSPHIGHO2_12_FULL_44_11]OGM68974.1 MAG: hypothetical protein A2975_02200 [Candidatus Woesebacteria bacterium RIFCSPLOWO2_01_FULL_44_14]
MTTISEQIEAIEKEIRETPYHKATEHHIGKLRAKLSKLKDKADEAARPRKSGPRQGYAVKKQGDATVVLIGPPSAGKSTLLNELTNAKSKVAPYVFTTVTVVPGMMEYKNARIQVLDVPGLIEGAHLGRGRGREVLSVARGADLIVFITDTKRTKVFDEIESDLYENGIRINRQPPGVDIEKKPSGGIIIHSNITQDLSKETIKEVASELGVKNAEITIREKLDIDRLIDAMSSNRVYLSAIYVVNKADLAHKPGKNSHLYVSAQTGEELNKLREKIWEVLELVNVYLVTKDEEPSYANPLIMKVGDTLIDVAQKIGQEFVQDKKRAVIWGTGAKFPGQEVSLISPIQEGMMVRFV